MSFRRKCLSIHAADSSLWGDDNTRVCDWSTILNRRNKRVAFWGGVSVQIKWPYRIKNKNGIRVRGFRISTIETLARAPAPWCLRRRTCRFGFLAMSSGRRRRFWGFPGNASLRDFIGIGWKSTRSWVQRPRYLGVDFRVGINHGPRNRKNPSLTANLTIHQILLFNRQSCIAN